MTETPVDFIALEESWVSDNLIAELQQSDMDLFVWTLNKDRSLQEFIGKKCCRGYYGSSRYSVGYKD